MKIVIYTQYFKGGGAEKRASVYANYLFKQGVDVELVSMHRTDEEYFIEPGIKRHFVSNSEIDYLKLSKSQRMKTLRKILLDIKPSIVISFLPTFAFYATFATRFCKELKHTKLIYMVTLYQRKYSFFQRLVDFACCLYADKISLQCKEQIKCNRLFKKKCIVNYNPIDDKWNDNIVRDYSKLSIISVGRLTKQKNFQLAIDGVALAHSKNPNISLDIFGDGPLKERLEKQIKELQAEEYIKIHPFSYELMKEFERHNILISSSKFEGFPNGLAEGMMSGLVCLSTPCKTGTKEIISQGENGFLFKNKKELVDTLISLSNDPSICSDISSKARLSIKTRFETSVVLPKLVLDLSSLDKD